MKLSRLAMMGSPIPQYLFLLMACCAHVAICSFIENSTDKLSLLEFKKTTGDPQQALTSWNDSTHFCRWKGVLCSAKHPNRVTSLQLQNQGLLGPISPSLGNLTFLRILSLSTNSFTGEIPPSLGHLHRLQQLNLINNTLQGRIPSFANCSRLEVLGLSNNQLIGQIPADLPHGLQQLILGSNNLTGIIPASLVNITALFVLGFESNNIEGSIPGELGRLSGLQYLYMGGNNFSGRFPLPILNLSNLINLNAADNGLTGDLPSNFGNSLRNVQLLVLGANFFRGHIPPSLTNASDLYFCDISRNELTGVVPSSIGKLSKLSWLNLEINKLQASTKQDWGFINSLTNCTELQVFSISVNRLQGNVPDSVGNLSGQLLYLYLANNQLSGFFPSGIANLRGLISVALNGNKLTGVVPDWIGSLGNLQKVALSSNFFTGEIPSSFSNMTRLEELYLDSNHFDGQIPPILGNLQTLGVLNISDNNLHGSIPKELFRIPTLREITLSFNNLYGPLHTDIGNAKQLLYLDITSNNLSGNLPGTLGDCDSVADIEVGHNAFSGNMPNSLGNITSLQILNLSHNNLTGSIPESLSRLQFLEQLDLSFNNLEGEVPTEGIFNNITAVKVDGNHKLCGGPVELHLLACPVIPLDLSKHKLSVALKVVIPVAIVVSLSIVISVLLFLARKQRTESISLPTFGREFQKISYGDVARATGGFSRSNLIGQGRYGSVYKGHLFQDGNMVAIKVFSLETRGAEKSFIAECNALRNVRHRNLVPILTACSTIDSEGNDFKALVYKYMPRGDLHNLLYSTQGSENTTPVNNVSLALRLRIITDVSDALAYLHHSHQGTIVHCDMKPSNILLDDDMVAHVGDFGLARLKFDSTTNSNSTTSDAIKGTIGYVAPECAGGCEVSTSSDVYSFGVVLLEIFIRRRPTDEMFKDAMSIAIFTELNFPDKVLQIVDPQLLQELDVCGEDGAQVLQSVLSIGLCCTKTNPNERISMQDVAAKLHGIRDAYQ
ncbi:hypothetical protein BS78_K012000 [Paspalum vaginatum]|uniref:Receptor kinase-like protein Xa21 n=1 Tax=Paspalum vaginatum TaxID=158149 RepID=A0A9W7XCB9_9POAL|nr:hypothetical protein BS78_K012000 [Paspalum vaginatum]KAJ1256505.1 hypothetical protein BS78_K012000 [Paspalum vaginatum]